MELSIDYFTAIPLYLQIAGGLLGQIEAGELAPGDRLPPERELSEQLGVNRMTLRQAFRVLETQGLLERRRGDGTYIASPKIEREINQLVAFSQGMKQRGYFPGAKVVLFEQQLAGASLAKPLQLAISAPVYYVHRLRLINNQPAMLEKFVLPVHRFPGLESRDLENRSLYEIMETDYKVTVSRAQQSLEAVSATEYEAEWLGLTPDAPLMLERRLGFDQAGQPVEYAKDLYRGDRFRFVTEVAALAL